MTQKMLRKIIIALCLLGTAYYGTKIFLLKDSISLSPANSMLLKFSMSSADAALLSACQKLFNKEGDVININSHATDTKKATLSVERRFPANALETTFDLRKKLQEQGCLKNEADGFSFQAIK